MFSNSLIRIRHLQLSEIRARLIRTRKLLTLSDSPKTNKEIMTQMFLNQQIMAEMFEGLLPELPASSNNEDITEQSESFKEVIQA